MKKNARQTTNGFAHIESLLLLVVIAGVIGIGAYVVQQKHKADKSLNSTSSLSDSQGLPTVSSGTTATIDQITQQEAQKETSVDSSADSSIQQSSTSANSSIDDLGGSYDESNL